MRLVFDMVVTTTVEATVDKPTRERVFDFVAAFGRERGYAPSFREVAEALDIASPATVHHHLRSLRDEGRLTYVDRQPRTVHITSTGTDNDES